MKFYSIIIIPLFFPLFVLSDFKKQQNAKEISLAENWNGTITWTRTSRTRGQKKWEDHGKENVHRWDKSFEFKITVNFVNGKGIIIRTERTSNYAKDSVIFVHKDDQYMIQEESVTILCEGKDTVELHVEYSEDQKHYWISFDTPDCNGNTNYERKNNIQGNTLEQKASGSGGGQLTLPANFTGQAVGPVPDFLQGSFNETIPAPDDPGGGEIITTATWSLRKGPGKPELIVSPASEDADYDNWLPEPGSNETIKGNDITIDLHLEESGGRSPNVKAKFFELKLVNTSKQPGVCLNAPITTTGVAKPDLRFLPQAGATLDPDGQSIKIPCEDGESGSAVLASYDGGGWTILNASVTLVNGKKIDGVLVSDKSKKNIPIPKNFSGGKIAEAWLKDNGNPGETDDKETSPGNSNNGDGLSAYEEYRGVISEGKFKRLDPNVKELGVKFNKSQLSVFNEGLEKFEKVTGFTIIRFYENEIPASRRVNQNGSHANIYPQFALHLKTGALDNLNGDAIGGPGIPSQVSSVIIDLNTTHGNYQDRVADATRMNTTLSYSEKDLIAVAIAHELAHGVNAKHHGPGPTPAIVINHRFEPNSTPAGRIFLYNGTEQSLPYTVTGQTGLPGNQQSGDLGCIMSLNFLCRWVGHETATLTTFYEVPIIPLAGHLCIFKNGTGINTGGKYFGDATNGNCTAQLKFK